MLVMMLKLINKLGLDLLNFSLGVYSQRVFKICKRQVSSSSCLPGMPSAALSRIFFLRHSDTNFHPRNFFRHQSRISHSFSLFPLLTFQPVCCLPVCCLAHFCEQSSRTPPYVQIQHFLKTVLHPSRSFLLHEGRGRRRGRTAAAARGATRTRVLRLRRRHRVFHVQARLDHEHEQQTTARDYPNDDQRVPHAHQPLPLRVVARLAVLCLLQLLHRLARILHRVVHALLDTLDRLRLLLHERVEVEEQLAQFDHGFFEPHHGVLLRLQLLDLLPQACLLFRVPRGLALLAAALYLLLHQFFHCVRVLLNHPQLLRRRLRVQNRHLLPHLQLLLVLEGGLRGKQSLDLFLEPCGFVPDDAFAVVFFRFR
mmetsp:Transcript_2222/g.5270  ORF Transcript_2222/g.5270 Transcript_2222/m.5270 type:complete len:368 (-) Transcript_2222:442-1545(-)